MRIVVAGAGQARKNEASIARACRSLGHQCRLVDVPGWRRRLGPLSLPLVRYLIDSFEPEAIIFTVSAYKLGQATLENLARRYRCAFWYFDVDTRMTDISLLLARAVGRLFITSRSRVPVYLQAGVSEVYFLPQGVDPFMDRPVPEAPERYQCDVSFVGAGHYPERHALLRAVAATCRMQVRGPRWEDAPPDLPVVGGPIYGKQFAQVVRGAAISLDAHSSPVKAGELTYTSNRLWKVLGCEGFYLGPSVPEIDLLVSDGRHCALYGDTGHAVELVRRYLLDPASREGIAATGRTHALAHHTYAHRIPLLLAGQGYPTVGG